LRISRRRQFKPVQPRYRINEQIIAPEVRVIDEEGKNLGIMPTQEAIKLARERELELIEVFPKAEPPIAKILDYGKFLYQKEKELRKQKAGQKRIEIKGIRLSLRISQHDKEIRLGQAKDFLEEGDKVKIEILLKGRERQYANAAKDTINQFINSLEAIIAIRIEQPLEMQGGKLSVILGRK
jgi:translation initiation factor IF-3